MNLKKIAGEKREAQLRRSYQGAVSRAHAPYQKTGRGSVCSNL